MSKALIPTLLVVLSVFFLPVYGQEDATFPSRTAQTVYFRFDRTDIDSTYAGNQSVLSALHALFTDSFRVSFIDTILISAFSSPEGRESYNLKLSRQRAAAVEQYLSCRYPLLSSIPLSLIPGGENWEGLQALVSASPDFEEREEVLMILDKVHDPARRERLLKRLNGGRAYRYMQRHILPKLRNAIVCTVRPNSRLNPAVLSATSRQARPAGEITAAGSHTARYPALAMGHTPPTMLHIAAPDVAATRSGRYSALKTNLAAWVTTSVNLAYEVQVGKRFSLDLPVMWSSWDLARTPALRILLFQPELRYWFFRPGSGHFLGLHLHVARYNLKWEEYRYQDTGYPLLGAGVSYGYALPLTDRWGMEFNFGAGYANSRYDTFHNVPNGQLRDTRLLHYWGITRLGLSFIYKLSKP